MEISFSENISFIRTWPFLLNTIFLDLFAGSPQKPRYPFFATPPTPAFDWFRTRGEQMAHVLQKKLLVVIICRQTEIKTLWTPLQKKRRYGLFCFSQMQIDTFVENGLSGLVQLRLCKVVNLLVAMKHAKGTIGVLQQVLMVWVTDVYFLIVHDLQCFN